MSKTLQEIQEGASCNWCRNALRNDPANISSKNFVDTGLKLSNGDQAYAIYCSECIENDFRVKQPKSAIDKNTLNEISIDTLQEIAKSKKDSMKTEKAFKTVSPSEQQEDNSNNNKQGSKEPATATTGKAKKT